MKPISSAITINPRGQSSKTGTQHGERGLVTQSSDDKLVAYLIKHPTAENNKLAVSLAQQCGVDLQVNSGGMRPCHIRGPEEARAIALSKIQNMEAQAPADTIEGWIAELSVMTAGKGETGLNADLQLTVYTSRLSQFPADVVKQAVLRHPWKWFPAWSELEALCVKLSAPRRSIISALKRKDAPDTRREATDEEKARAAALVAELFPDVPDEWREGAVREVMAGYKMDDTPNSPDREAGE